MPHLARPRGVITLAAALVLSSACTAAEEPRSAPATTTTAAPTTPPPPPPPPPVLWPLTGVQTDALVERPALAVKIENSVDARPQTGLGAADLVWEEVVEGGITRFVAVYQSALPPEIGPVRSVRPMDAAIVAPMHGLLAFSGGQRPFVDAVAQAGTQVISQDAGAGGFHRTSSRRAPHNIYANPQQLLDQADDAHRAPPAPQFTAAAPGTPSTPLAVGVPTGSVRLTLSPSSHPAWTWSPADGAWLRTEGAAPAVEADGRQLRATNLVVLRVDVVNTPFVDAIGTPVPETLLVGGGDALVAADGRTLAVRWSKASVTDPVVLTGPDGGPVALAPGSTWVELVPNRGGAVATG
ncbi:DUF3048 domain-containing protein [Geodermatophilus sp. URMC 64]